MTSEKTTESNELRAYLNDAERGPVETIIPEMHVFVVPGDLVA